MPRSSSVSSIPHDLTHAYAPTAPLSDLSLNTQSPSSPSRTHALRQVTKASSFADLRHHFNRKLGRRAKTSHDFDFECSGSLDEEDEISGDQTVHARAPSQRPPLSSASASFASLPPRPAPYAFPLHEPLSDDEARRLARLKEEELAAEACLSYITSHSSSATHRRKTSRSSSLAHLDTTGLSLGPALASLSLRRGSAQSDFGVGGVDEQGRSRAGSVTASSICSSRPRTNDSLPSFAESASTIDSTGSFPPSPVQSPSLRSRPTFSTAFQCGIKVDPEAVAQQSRAYAFI